MQTTEQGSHDLEALGKKLKAAGSGDLKKELLRGIREVGKAEVPKIRESALRILPARGGLAALIGKSKIATRTRLSGDKAGVEIKGTDKHDIKSINEGILRHPVYKKHGWVQQSVTPGWFDAPISEDLHRIQSSIQRVMSDVAHKIEASI